MIRVGLAGLGRMGQVHARTLAARGGITAVYDADPARAAAFDAPAAGTFAELLERCDAVVIATPTGTHASLVSEAAAAGRHVFCEKPISLDRAAAVSAVEACEQAGVVLQVGFHRRYDPDWVAAAARIHAGELGEVTFLRSSLRDMDPPDPAYLANSGGFFTDMLVHDLDVARWLGGEVVSVTAHGSAHDPGFVAADEIETAVIVLRFASGALGVLDSSRSARYGYESSTEVMGTLATARIDAPHPRGLEWRTPGAATRGFARDFEQRYPFAYAGEITAFLDCVRDGTPPRAGGRDALAAADLADAATESWRTGTTVSLDVHSEVHA